uniref:Kinesin motor domain-containing protein n=1 Tax=Macrostomum lignano TaxID=282301 RepID=A0A1I8FN93_9PLAT
LSLIVNVGPQDASGISHRVHSTSERILRQRDTRAFQQPLNGTFVALPDLFRRTFAQPYDAPNSKPAQSTQLAPAAKCLLGSACDPSPALDESAGHSGNAYVTTAQSCPRTTILTRSSSADGGATKVLVDNGGGGGGELCIKRD